MKVQVQMKDGMVCGVIVRYAPNCGLYTTERMLSICLKGKTVYDVVGASAPFAVFKGEWNAMGYVQQSGFYKDENRVAEIPFVDNRWNYM